MATTYYSKSSSKTVHCLSGSGSPVPVTVETVDETGYRQKPFIDKTLYTARDCARWVRSPGSYVQTAFPLGPSVWAVPNRPYYGESYGYSAAVAFNSGSTWLDLNSYGPLRAYQKAMVYNRAFDRFAEDLMSKDATADLGVTVMEGREALEMMQRRVVNLALAVKEARTLVKANARFRSLNRERYRKLVRYVREAFRVGENSFSGSLKRVANSPRHLAHELLDKVSSGWLEHWLGWAPFVSEMSKTLDVLQNVANKLSTEGVHLKSSALGKFEATVTESGAYRKGTHPLVIHYRVTFSGRVRISDGGTFYARRAGLTNLPGIIWAGVPLSFIYDWFVDVGGMLKHLDAFTGVEWMDGTVSYHTQCWASENHSYRHNNGGPWVCTAQAVTYGEVYKRTRLSKAPKAKMIPQVKDLTKLFEGKEHRAATAISLLIQQLFNQKR